MKVTIEFGTEVEPAIQTHLDEGVSVQAYIKAAVSFFNFLLEKEKSGSAVGFGDPSRFKSYGQVKEVSPKDYLAGARARVD